VDFAQEQEMAASMVASGVISETMMVRADGGDDDWTKKNRAVGMND
jgi:hypothetical protein